MSEKVEVAPIKYLRLSVGDDNDSFYLAVGGDKDIVEFLIRTALCDHYHCTLEEVITEDKYRERTKEE
mgnify:CR=1 FL=1